METNKHFHLNRFVNKPYLPLGQAFHLVKFLFPGVGIRVCL